jgi:hypothetical protein
MFKTKLGTNKGLPLSRVWIEGLRLDKAGFHKGSRYCKFWEAGKLILRLDRNGPLKVSGKGESHPIIDITGKAIAESFGTKGQYVNVAYDDAGYIVLSPE